MRGGTAPGRARFGRNATRFATTLATLAVFGRIPPNLAGNSLTVAAVILHALEHRRQRSCKRDTECFAAPGETFTRGTKSPASPRAWKPQTVSKPSNCL